MREHLKFKHDLLEGSGAGMIAQNKPKLLAMRYFEDRQAFCAVPLELERDVGEKLPWPVKLSTKRFRLTGPI